MLNSLGPKNEIVNYEPDPAVLRGMPLCHGAGGMAAIIIVVLKWKGQTS
jgi:hypothetical protein